jgi:acyl-CoA synthetase (AMP-forming)/AMP-acid ligase II
VQGVSALTRRLAATSVLLRSNFVPFERPDRLMRAMVASMPWGLGTAGALAAACARYPEVNAVVDDEGALTYGELWWRSDGIARRLRELGARRGTAVGVLSRNHRGFVEAVVAVAKTEADLVLMNTGFAGPQLADVAGNEGVSILVHDAELADVAAAASGVALLGDAEMDGAATSGRAAAPTRHQGRTVILTSGTTGRPKGAVRRPDVKAIEGLSAVLERIPLRALDVTVVAAPMFHAWGFSHLMMGLGRNATVIVSRRFDPAGTLELVDRHRARVLVVVPVMLQRMLALPPAELARFDTTALDVIAVSGSALGGRLATEVLNRYGPVLYNTYGSTEVAVAAIATPQDLLRHPSTVGRPAPGVRVEILDGDGAPMARGLTGRVFVGGAARFDGYTSGPGKEVQHGLLSSGDMGHFDADGRLFIDGRDDDMIVSGGENVYPAEVEELLAHHPAVAEVAVIGVPDEEFGQALSAFVVVRPGHELDVEAVRHHVRSHLARYKVPRRVTFLDELPRNPTGKVLKRALAER